MAKQNRKICCKGNGDDIPICEYNSAWLCKHPGCTSPILTSTMLGVRPSGCPKIERWNNKRAEWREHMLHIFLDGH